jgi:hypothetical protein
VVGLSGLVFGNYWQLHYIAGLSLIPLLLVKLGSATYRALSYYMRRAVYRAAGAPEWAGRLLAPALIASTIIAMATGIWMWSQHSEAQPWAKLHVLSVLAMGACVGLHLLLRTPLSLQSVARDGVAGLRHNVPRIRIALVGVALAIGLIVGLAGGARSPFPSRSTHAGPERSTAIARLTLRLNLSIRRLAHILRGLASHECNVARPMRCSQRHEASQSA